MPSKIEFSEEIKWSCFTSVTEAGNKLSECYQSGSALLSCKSLIEMLNAAQQLILLDQQFIHIGLIEFSAQNGREIQDKLAKLKAKMRKLVKLS